MTPDEEGFHALTCQGFRLETFCCLHCSPVQASAAGDMPAQTLENSLLIAAVSIAANTALAGHCKKADCTLHIKAGPLISRKIDPSPEEALHAGPALQPSHKIALP